MGRLIRTYFALTHFSLQNAMAYRIRFFMGLATALIQALVLYYMEDRVCGSE